MNLLSILSFVDKIHEGGDVYTFRFIKPRDIRHKAGQHGIFFLPGLYRPHPFTISAAPEEDYITISTHVRAESRFKQRLMAFKKDDTIFMIGPVMSFTFDKEARRHVFLAQGIGVTPFRSMLVHADRTSRSDKIVLVHVDSNAHPFRELTEKYASKAYYPEDKDMFEDIVRKQSSEDTFYISGSPQFVKATKNILRSLGIDKNVKTDSFLGY